MSTKRRLLVQTDCSGAELQLWEHIVEGKREHELVMNGVFLMASYNRLSSQALIRTALERVGAREDVQVLIGGLGMGFSAGEACRRPNVSRIDVVEISPMIVAWNQEFFREHNQNCLDDERVRVIVCDFHDYVCESNETYDVVCMDIDNGPALLVREQNRRVYEAGFFARVKTLLRPCGVFLVWSCSEDKALEDAGRAVFSTCEVETVTERHNGKDVPYFLYVWHCGKGSQ